MSDFEKVLKDNGVPTTEAEITAKFRESLTESGSKSRIALTIHHFGA